MDPFTQKKQRELWQLLKRRQKGANAPLLAEIARYQVGLGLYAEAEKTLREALALAPGDIKIATSLVEVMMTQNYYVQALHLLEQLLRVAPDANLYALAGVCFTKMEKIAEAETQFRRSLALDARNMTANTYCANLLWSIGRKKEGRDLAEKAMNYNSSYQPLLMCLANMYRDEHRSQDALPILRKLMDNPQYKAHASTQYANACIDVGEFDEAEKTLAPLIKDPATRARALYLTSTIGKRKEDPEFEAAVKSLLARPDIMRNDRVDGLYALSKYYDDTGRYAEAVDYGRQAKKLENRNIDMDAERQFVDASIQFVQQSRFADVPKPEIDADFCFVVGMPRSGTTLTEQTIAKLPDAVSLGELTYFGNAAKQLGFMQIAFEDYYDKIFSLTSAELRDLAEAYLAECHGLGTGKLYVDKMPHNFQHLALIRLVLPQAKFVWCQRNPVDTCLSIFLNRFNESHGYIKDLATLGLYYREYERLMAHWQTIPALEAFPLDYQAFVSDGGETKKALLEYVAPGQSEAADEDKQNLVRTFSRWQARQPIYQSSVERWRRYEGHIDDLLQALHWPREQG